MGGQTFPIFPHISLIPRISQLTTRRSPPHLSLLGFYQRKRPIQKKTKIAENLPNTQRKNDMTMSFLTKKLIIKRTENFGENEALWNRHPK